MNNIGKNSFDIGYMETLAAGASPLHRLDPRAKLFTTVAFIVAVVSFDRYALAALAPFFLYPIVMISLGGLPAGYVVRKMLIAAPFAVAVGIFNPLLDRHIVMHIGSMGISAGWISFASILARFMLTVTAALVLVSLTGFNAVCNALAKLGVPRPFVTQLLFFYRYLFVLTDEAERMSRARSLRSCGARAAGFKVFVPLIGNLLLRTLERAERIYRAMCCRGFDGTVRILREAQIGSREVIFMLGWTALFVLFRFVDVTGSLGAAVTRLLR